MRTTQIHKVLGLSHLTAISGYLSSLNSSNSEQQTLVDNVRSDLGQLNASFANLVSFLETDLRM